MTPRPETGEAVIYSRNIRRPEFQYLRKLCIQLNAPRPVVSDNIFLLRYFIFTHISHLHFFSPQGDAGLDSYLYLVRHFNHVLSREADAIKAMAREAEIKRINHHTLSVSLLISVEIKCI